MKALLATGTYLKEVGGATHEVRTIADKVEAVEAMLKSLKASLRTIHRSDEFYGIWGNMAHKSVSGVRSTIVELNSKLGASRKGSRLSFWSKVTWPLSRDDCQILQQDLQLYMQMLTVVQNAFLQ